MDNLFVSAALLAKLWDLGFGGAGTVRTTKTKREVLESKVGEKAQKALSKKEKNRGLEPGLAELKTKYGAQIPWGELYGAVSKDGKCLQFAWKDQQVVLFMSNVSSGRKTVIRQRKRPALTSTNARTSRAVFGDEAVKELAIPDFIDLYNHYMNGVDVADQLRCYYNTQRVHKKTWKPLWHFLLDTTICNSYKIVNAIELKPHGESRDHYTHLNFRSALVAELFERSERLPRNQDDEAPIGAPTHGPKPKTLAQLVNHSPEWAHERLTRLGGRQYYCVACSFAGRTSVSQTRPRVPLQELSRNSKVASKRRQRPRRSYYGCGLCGLYLCQSKVCWNDHIKAI